MSEPDKKSPSGKFPRLQDKCHESQKPKPQKISQSGNNFHSHINSIMENLKSTFKKFLNTGTEKSAITSDLLNLISISEKVIKDFYGGILKKVTDFADTDLQKLKTMSKEETEKTRKILLQYAAALQKISEEKLKQLMEAKERLQTRIFKREELHSVAKFFDEKMGEVKKLTEEVYNSLSKGETAPFVKDLQKMVEKQSNTVKSSLNSFLVAAKENIPKLQESLKSISAKNALSKLPKIAQKYKLPAPFSKIFIQKPSGCVNDQGITDTIKKSMVSFKNKLQFTIGKVINSDNIHRRTNSTMGHGQEGGESFKGLARIFNSQTDFGRANVSKATYAVTALVIAYFYLKPSKKPAPK